MGQGSTSKRPLPYDWRPFKERPNQSVILKDQTELRVEESGFDLFGIGSLLGGFSLMR
jgi:hypothetical protein